MQTKKKDTTLEELCEDLPIAFFKYMHYVRNLAFEVKPDYKYVKSLFEGLFKELNCEEDGNLDWVIQK